MTENNKNEAGQSLAHGGQERPELTIYDKVDALSSTEQNRYYKLAPQFGESALEILDYYRGKKVPHQWHSFESNVSKVNDETGEQRDYFLDLGQAFVLKQGYRHLDVVTVVMSTREKNSLPRFEDDIPKLCFAEFNTVFLVEKTEQSRADGSKYLIYTPVFSLVLVR